MVEVDGADLVARLMIILVESVAGDGVGDDTLHGKRIVVGAPEEVLIRMRVFNQVGAMLGQFWPEIGTLEPSKPKRSGGNSRIGAPDHLELQVSDDAGERHGR